ncbi:MAG: methyl-accepting chemotaxis protein [Phenylobacterium sp.]|jgi:methyl-accepting chemotaxis protein|uniref:PAS domain S-box protein n=3 Tax=Brevundimonas TaxID=41275 RepID=A0AB37E8K3_9CAUL|nr:MULTISPECIES: methyl-accepting chemotaxis protein [Brevundimonas]EDX82292.1 PAS fold family [Brevundimonas sp. BAL3]MBA4332815.1 PAS domain S-box protein [Brevundimonas sp.]MDZ4376116.1 methyl-accepting chemotaxis protein [Phenylobacterium sp.]QIH73275.1 PAS domain S-box protein [Brevundimonas mediterranea]
MKSFFQPRPSPDAAETAELRSMMAAVQRSQAVIEFELDGTIISANPNFLAVIGYELAEVKGRHHRMLMDPAEAASPAYTDFWRRLNAGEFIADKFIRYGKGGARAVIEASYNPIFGADGKPYKVVKFATDVTAAEVERERRAEADRVAAEVQASVVQATGRGLSAMAAGDLSYRIGEAFPGDYAILREDFNRAMAALDEAVAVIRGNAGSMQSGANEISSAAEDLSRRTERQAAGLEQTAAALDEITATVRKAAENAQAADVVVGQTRSQAETGGAVVQRAITAMGEIEKSSDQIGQIIGVIDEIAFQTNLLALNAGVEAARAGEAGRGFAVVASEVRALAQRSADSAREIKTLISTSSTQVKSGVVLVRESGEALSAIAVRINDITHLMGEIRASTQEQALALAEVNTAVNEMDQVTQQNAAMVEESTAASLSLSREASDLTQLVGRFQVSEDGADRSPTPIRDAHARIAAFAAVRAPARSRQAGF